ncbi:MAG: hypothetical protein CM15mP121_1170 [Bacteroidota bacterium]|nr:MAG: hypothetical protein CM15mP121_1170 [Bacteroidota bacterium]
MKSQSLYKFLARFSRPLSKNDGVFSDNLGKYPYDQYSIIMGGDGEWNMLCAPLLLAMNMMITDVY